MDNATRLFVSLYGTMPRIGEERDRWLLRLQAFRLAYARRKPGDESLAHWMFRQRMQQRAERLRVKMFPPKG